MAHSERSPWGLTPEAEKIGLPIKVRARLEDLPVPQQEIFWDGYWRKSKSLLVAYLAWLLLGTHYLYLGGRWVPTVLMLLIAYMPIGIAWWLIDAFRLPRLVREYNCDMAIHVLRKQRLIPE